jgi:hypothetical protein
MAGTTKNTKMLIGGCGTIVVYGHKVSRVLVGSRLSRYAAVWRVFAQKHTTIEV